MKKTRIVAGVASFAMLLLNFVGVKAGAETDAITITPDQKYILADVGKAISLSSITIKPNDTTTVTGDLVSWTPGSGVTVQDGKLSATETGPHAVTVSAGGYTDTVYVFAKSTTDTDYVLYQENFDTMADSTFPDGWTRAEGTSASAAAVYNHEFVLNAKNSPDNPSRVILPSYLGMFGDYQVQADVKIAECNETSRWASLMYRIQNTNGSYYPYYQMCVRAAASATGVEFAERTASNQWNVITKASNSTDLDSNTYYQFKIRLQGDRVKESINGTSIIDSNAATAYQKGMVGIQANGCKIAVDNIRITLPTTQIPEQKNTLVDVYQPDADITNAPSIITDIKSASDFNSIAGDVRPATAILHLDSALNVVGSDGKALKSMNDALAALNNKVMPAFYVNDEETVNALSAYINESGLYDLFVMSDKSDLVALARTKMPKVRGAVVFSQTDASMSDVVKATNSGSARIAVLPQSLATKSNMEYLQNRLITVWESTNDGITDQADIANVITEGANGIITDNYKGYYDAFGLFKGLGSLVRKSFVIGHRGLSSVCPENTLISAQKAYEAGADCIENDIWLTTDGQIVIMHDSTVSTTTDGTGNIEDMTLAQVKALNCTQFTDEYPNTKVPTLEEYFEYFKGKNVIHFIEIKSSKPEIVNKLKELMDKYGVEDQCVVISFIGSQLKRVHKVIPTLSLGCLTNDCFGTDPDMNSRVDKTLNVVTSYNSTINPGYYDVSKDYLNAVKDRGITVWPWTLNDSDSFNYYMMMGGYGVTSNYADWATDYADGIIPTADKYVVKEGEKSQITAQVHTYGDKTKEVPVSVVYVKGDNILNVQGSDITATGTGTVTVMLKYEQKTSSAYRQYFLYSKAVTIEVVKNNSTTTTNTESTATATGSTTTGTVITSTETGATGTVTALPTDTQAASPTTEASGTQSPRTGSHGVAAVAVLSLLAGLITIAVQKKSE